MWTATESIEIAASPETVWRIVSDVQRHPLLAGSGEVLEVRLGGPLGVGSEWEADERVKAVGRFTARSECTRLDPPKAFGWRSFPPPIKKGNPDSIPDVRWLFELAPAGSGTALQQTFTVTPPKAGGGMMKAFYLLTRRASTIRRGVRKTLENVKEAAEREA